MAASPTNATSPKPGFDLNEFVNTQEQSRKAPAKKRGRGVARLLFLALLAGGGWMAKEHGPALYEQYVTKASEDVPTEAAAPLAFPNVTTIAAPIRTAEFVLVGLPETPGAMYRVTTDFETDVSQVDIARESAPDLQILTYGNDAMIRRADGEQWYLLDRGQFPLDGRLERSDWVRMIDELLPPDVRAQVTISASTDSVISTVPTRHLSLTMDPALFDAATNTSPAPAEPVPAATEALPDTQADSEPTPATGDPLDAGAAVPVTAPIEVEVWIDGQGLVRQVSGAPQLGAETITIVNTSADAWIPDYPAASEIAPLTASALVDLGL